MLHKPIEEAELVSRVREALRMADANRTRLQAVRENLLRAWSDAP